MTKEFLAALPSEDDFERELAKAPSQAAVAKRKTYVCPTCHGDGKILKWYGSKGRLPITCPQCKGRKEFTTSPAERGKARASAEARRDRKAKEAWADFERDHAEMAAWMKAAAGRGFEFALSMWQAVIKYGHLTEKQFAAVERCMMRDKERQEERAKIAEPVGALAASKIIAALNTAKSNGLKRPKLRVGSLAFSLAGAGSRNAGHVYVKDGGEYVGKVSPAGQFFKAREATQEQVALVLRVGENPLEEAVAHGRRTGSCSCCGRELTDPASIEAGIGPICASRYGF